MKEKMIKVKLERVKIFPIFIVDESAVTINVLQVVKIPESLLRAHKKVLKELDGVQRKLSVYLKEK
jgi:hypothetical protein